MKERVPWFLRFQMSIRCKVAVHACGHLMILRPMALIFINKTLTGAVKVGGRVKSRKHFFIHFLFTFLARQFCLGFTTLRTFRGGSYFSPFLVILIS